MKTSWKAAVVVLSGLMFVGCEKKDEATTPATPPAQTTGNTVTDAVNKATGTVETAAADAKAKATDAVASATDTAKTKLAQVAEYLKDKKLDAADTALKEVEGVKGSLPQSLQDQVTALRTQLDTAKAASGAGVNLPSLPGAGK